MILNVSKKLGETRIYKHKKISLVTWDRYHMIQMID